MKTETDRKKEENAYLADANWEGTSSSLDRFPCPIGDDGRL